MSKSLKSISKSSSKTEKIPKGATILKEDIDIRVRTISNGFIVTKSSEVKYQLGKEVNYTYITEEAFSEVNPLKSAFKGTDLINDFDEDNED